ncbi:hypothetical protein VTI74DRAFT_8998 [Chaetomium olivicolor]
MVRFGVISALIWAAGLVVASPHPHPGQVSVRTRNLPGTTDEDTLHFLWRRLAELVHLKRETVFSNSTSISKSWDNAVLFSHGFAPNASNVPENLEAGASIEVKCVTCYFTAGATARLEVNGTFDLGDTVKNVTNQLKVEFKNLTTTAIDSMKVFVDNVKKELKDIPDPSEEFEFDKVFNFDNFTIDTDIDIDLPPLPEVGLLLQIDSLDLYMMIDTTLSAHATLTMPLFRSNTPLGITAGDGLELGIFVTMDLILSAEGEISLRTGFHLLLEKPVGFNLALFSQDVSEVIFNGGKFEFLPVTIVSGSVALKAVLRVGMHAGFEVSTGALSQAADLLKPFHLDDDLNFSMGVEFGVFAHVAEFLTNITGGTQLAEQEKGCGIKIVEEYTLALGAMAGATLAFREHTWGPQPNTTIPIFYTTLADVCAVRVDAKTTPPASPTTATTLARRQVDPNLTTTVISTTALLTAIGCASPNMVVCPASLQTTTIQTTTKTMTTAVSRGVTPTFPESTALTVASTIPFGRKVNKLDATSGTPTSYVPPPPTTSTSSAADGKKTDGGIIDDIGEVINGSTGGVSNKLIIGLSVGLGVPVLALLIGGLIWCIKRRRYSSLPNPDAKSMGGGSGTAIEYTGGSTGYDSPLAAERAAERETMLKKEPSVTVASVGEEVRAHPDSDVVVQPYRDHPDHFSAAK